MAVLNSIERAPVHPFLLLVSFLVVYACLSRLYNHLKIRRLGERAPYAYGLLPGGFDILVRSLYHSHKSTDLLFWRWLFHRRNAHHSTAEFILAGQRFIFTANPENIKAVLAGQFDDFGKGEFFHRLWSPFLGDSIFTTDGPRWHYNRQLLRPQFVKTRIVDMNTMEVHVNKLMDLMGGAGEEIDVSSLFYRYTLDLAVDFLLATSINSIEQPRVEFAQAFAEVQRVQNLLVRMGPFEILYPRRSYKAGLKVLDDFINPIIDHALSFDLKSPKTDERGSFLHALTEEGVRDRKTLRDQIVAILLAGRDTTAGTLSFLFHELSQHPEIVSKLRREIERMVGWDRAPSYQDLKDMKYLQHCINEVLRLYPAVPYNIRVALNDTTLPTGGGSDGMQPLGVPKDTQIGYSVLYMQNHLPDLYPPISSDFAPIDVFSPERWDVWQPKPWHYIPFNGGPRLCIGQQFALTEIGYTVVRILQRFNRIEKRWIDDGKPLCKAEIVLSPTRPVKIGLWRAKQE